MNKRKILTPRTLEKIRWLEDEIKRLQADAATKYQRGIEVVAMNATKLRELKDQIELLQTKLKAIVAIASDPPKAKEVRGE